MRYGINATGGYEGSGVGGSCTGELLDANGADGTDDAGLKKLSALYKKLELKLT
jgi:hypothetical protein